MKQKEKVFIKPHPDKVLIKVTKANWNSLFSKYITTAEGKKVELFIDVEEDAGYERKFQQNISVGVIVAVGENVIGLLKGDMAIIDYSVTGNDDALVGFVNGDRLVSIDGTTTYHANNSPVQMNGRFAFVIGDYDNLSKLLGVVRMGKLISRSPYVFLQHEPESKLVVTETGMMVEKKDVICNRKVLSADKDTIAKEGDTIIVKESDLFDRVIDGKKVSVIFDRDIIATL